MSTNAKPLAIEWGTGRYAFKLRVFGPHPSGEATFDLIRLDQQGEWCCSNITPAAARELRDWLNAYLREAS